MREGTTSLLLNLLLSNTLGLVCEFSYARNYALWQLDPSNASFSQAVLLADATECIF